MKKLTAFLLAALTLASLSACGEELAPEPATSTVVGNHSVISQTADSQTSKGVSDGETVNEGNKILIAYFSYGENTDLPAGTDASTSASIQLLNGEFTGNTGLVANYIQKATGGELFSIRTVEKYAPDYNTVIDQGQAEKNNQIKPEIATHIDHFEDYDVVFVGFPNWWYGMPMVMNSFFDEYDFSGKTVIPFCTSGGSAFSNAIAEIKAAEPNATILDGLHIGASQSVSAENTVTEWVRGLDL